MRTVFPDPSGIAEALSVLRAGGVVAHATETCYGLACDLSNPEAVAKLFAVKKRPASMPVSALFASVKDAKDYVLWNERAEELAKGLPGPITLILPMRSDAPSRLFITAESALEPTTYNLKPSVGIRVSPHPTAMALVTGFGSPLSTTSANLHGEANPYNIGAIAACDLILDDGTLPAKPPSTVIDLTNEQPKTLRP